MVNMDDPENNAKVSDSAYSNSCSNSQSRRSHSSKSTHSGSNSSGSSGYGGKKSNYSEGSGQRPDKRIKEKDPKKKKSTQMDSISSPSQTESENRSLEPMQQEESKEENLNDGSSPASAFAKPKSGVETMNIALTEATEENNTTDEVESRNTPAANASQTDVATSQNNEFCSNGFSCVISMHDGVVIYTTTSLTVSLGFPKHMWIGRSFIDFVHPKDRQTFAAQITTGLAIPKNENGTQQKAPCLGTAVSTMVCRIRRYRGLTTGYCVKEKNVSYSPFLLKLSFKNIADEEGKVIYLVIQATQFVSAFKVPNEIITNAIPFVIRHAANGNLEYIDPESVPYLGYVPQDICEKNALQFYHPEDLSYLRQVYETIVKEGGVSRSKSYRMLVQNGDYLNVETEWSSFINPWSRKLEFVIGKHHILEGPLNPDVFYQANPEIALKQTADEKAKTKQIRDSIIRIMNEVLTKPAEMVKHQMSKRCQDLAAVMENLIEDQPKVYEELQIDIQDPDYSSYERDSVMLGGISPHHDHNDSKSSTETPVSYNQLNYNENLQRYFDSHQQFTNEAYNNKVPGKNVKGSKERKTIPGVCASPIALLPSGSIEAVSSGESSGIVEGSPQAAAKDYHPTRLTEFLLSKHNAEMEKELVKLHRENRSVNKADKDKISNENRNKNKEHLARCHASFQPANDAVVVESQPHGVKRASNTYTIDPTTYKHHCPSQRQNCQQQPDNAITFPVESQQWPSAALNSMNSAGPILFGVGIPQQMPVLNPIPPVPGMFPFYYAPAGNPMMPNTTNMNLPQPAENHQYTPQAMQCMLYGQAIYGPPIMCSPVTPHVSYPLQDNLMAQTWQFSNILSNPSLNNPKDQKDGLSKLPKSKIGSLWRDKKRSKSTRVTEENADSSNSSTQVVNQSAAMGSNTLSTTSNPKTLGNGGDRTDGESSYSSFYSSFFKTDSGSAEESDNKKLEQTLNAVEKPVYFNEPEHKKVPKRKMEPPWMEEVSVTSELIYKYQVLTKSLDEVLIADQEKISKFEQPILVNEQLSQLYLNLQLEGVTTTLSLEEDVTSSSSSGDESTNTCAKVQRRKRDYSKLGLIYEEETPLPPASDEEPLDEIPLDEQPSVSTIY